MRHTGLDAYVLRVIRLAQVFLIQNEAHIQVVVDCGCGIDCEGQVDREHSTQGPDGLVAVIGVGKLGKRLTRWDNYVRFGDVRKGSCHSHNEVDDESVTGLGIAQYLRGAGKGKSKDSVKS